MKRVGIFVSIVVIGTLTAPGLRADEPAPCGNTCCPCITCVDQLFALSECELFELYKQGTCPPLFCGYLDGYSLNRAGKCLAKPIGKSLHVVWKGKYFHPDECKITNRWFKKLEGVAAALEIGPSLYDGCPAIIMDYRGMSSIVWANQRDELRQIAPNLYLGIAYREKKGCMRFAQFFALQGCVAAPGCAREEAAAQR